MIGLMCQEPLNRFGDVSGGSITVHWSITILFQHWPLLTMQSINTAKLIQLFSNRILWYSDFVGHTSITVLVVVYLCYLCCSRYIIWNTCIGLVRQHFYSLLYTMKKLLILLDNCNTDTFCISFVHFVYDCIGCYFCLGWTWRRNFF